MTELKSRIHDKSNGLDYVLVGDYYVPDLKLPEEHRPIGMWGRLHRTYLEQYRPTRFSALCLSGELHTYLADLDEQATERCSLIIEQMKQAEGVTETMKADNQMLWVQSMNSIPLMGRLQKFIHLSLTISDIQQDLNPNYPDTRFVFGYAHDKEIYSLEVEGQKPDGIIEYEEYGRTMYMWYYNDLESNKRGDCLSYSVDVPE